MWSSYPGGSGSRVAVVPNSRPRSFLRPNREALYGTRDLSPFHVLRCGLRPWPKALIEPWDPSLGQRQGLERGKHYFQSARPALSFEGILTPFLETKKI